MSKGRQARKSPERSLNRESARILEQLPGFMLNESRHAQRAHESIIKRLDGYVSDGILKKTGFKYELNPLHGGTARSERFSLNLIRIADELRSSLTMVRRAREEMERHRGAALINAKLAAQSYAELRRSVTRCQSLKSQLNSSRNHEVHQAADLNRANNDQHESRKEPWSIEMAKKVSKKTASKTEPAAATEAESTPRIKYDELSDNQRRQMLTETGNELIAALEAKDSDAARRLRVKLRRLDPDWTENCKAYVTYMANRAKAAEAAEGEKPAKASKKTSKKTASKTAAEE